MRLLLVANAKVRLAWPMLFNSGAYLGFLPLVTVLHWLLPSRARALWLLLASYFFYAWWSVPYLGLMIGLTAANFSMGIAQAQFRGPRRLAVALAVAMNLLVLGIFKYLGFLEQLGQRAASLFGLDAIPIVVNVVLPLGLSFFVFEFIHYQIDIHRGYQPIHDPIRFALFPAFFPTQIAGPIKRFQDFDAQVGRRPRFDAALFVDGLQLIVLGLVKKIVLADSLRPLADAVFANTGAVSRFDALAGTMAFGFQIYLDFSGYTDIGRGSAQLLGYRMPANFRTPYLATSVRDFWRRWHITLSSWLRDYLYIPLGGSRIGSRRTLANLVATMSLGGLWHGAAIHFILWGFLHGIALATHRWVGGIRQPTVAFRLPTPVRILIAWACTQAVVMLLWALFRVPLLEATALWSRLVFGGGTGLLDVKSLSTILLIVVAVVGADLFLQAVHDADVWRHSWYTLGLRPISIAAAGVLVLVFTVNGHSTTPFIYFQF
jgi:D-alanyl-lipoteichoic acid acyltransferase DltB (MBOAT superfamily)